MQNQLTEKQTKSQILGIHDDIGSWDQTIANELAKAENIKLTDEHIAILGYLRGTYKKHGQIEHAHSLTQALNTRFASKGGIKYLYTLFPKGPISQGCKIAGVPAPSESRNQSFGTSC